MTKRKGAAWGTARALDEVRRRRSSGAASSGSAVAGPGIQVLRNGSLSMAVGELFFFDGAAKLQLREPAEPLTVTPGSPKRYALKIGPGFTVEAGHLVPQQSPSVRVNAAGQMIATPTTADVVNAEDATESAQAAIARKVNTGDGRLSIGRGIATLVAGTVTVPLASIVAGAIVLMAHETFGGTPGLLSYAVNAGVGFDITSANVADTSTVAWVAWNT